MRWKASPAVAYENVDTSDGRFINSGAINWPLLPLPLLWQELTADGHANSRVVGTIDSVTRITMADGGVAIYAEGDLLGSAPADLIEGIRAGAMNGISIDLAAVDWQYEVDAEGYEKAVVYEAEMRGATLVASPAFLFARIEIVDEDARGLVASSKLEGEGWCPACFETPSFAEPTRVRVEGDKISGHIALWGTCHTSFKGACITPPRSKIDYAAFHRSQITLANGETMMVGKLTVDGNHAGPYVSPAETAAHYDDTSTLAAVVRAGEDEHGIWVTGHIVPWADDATRQLVQLADWSGDWRELNRNLELIAVLGVNTPGFPVVQGTVQNGRQLRLVASAQFADDEPVAVEDQSLETTAASTTDEVPTRIAVEQDLLDRIDRIEAGLTDLERARREARLGELRKRVLPSV